MPVITPTPRAGAWLRSPGTGVPANTPPRAGAWLRGNGNPPDIRAGAWLRMTATHGVRGYRGIGNVRGHGRN